MQPSPDTWPTMADMPLGPIPTNFDLGGTTVQGIDFVVLRCSTAAGVGAYYLPPEVARELGRALIAAAEKRRLIVPVLDTERVRRSLDNGKEG